MFRPMATTIHLTEEDGPLPDDVFEVRVRRWTGYRYVEFGIGAVEFGVYVKDKDYDAMRAEILRGLDPENENDCREEG